MTDPIDESFDLTEDPSYVDPALDLELWREFDAAFPATAPCGKDFDPTVMSPERKRLPPTARQLQAIANINAKHRSLHRTKNDLIPHPSSRGEASDAIGKAIQLIEQARADDTQKEWWDLLPLSRR